MADRHRRPKLSGLDIRFIDMYREERTRQGVGPKTLYYETVIIRQLANFAFSRGMINRDPLKGLKIREPKPTPQPCWTPVEVESILEASSGNQRSAFTVLADTGMRIAELRYLIWTDVDFPNNRLHIRPKDDWRPKTGDQRAIPMSARVKAILESMSRNGRWVFRASPSPRNPAGDRQISERRLLVSLKRVLKRLKLKGHLHTFRHAVISRSLISGIPEAVVRSWVGHVDEDTIKLYTHIADAQSQAAMEKLEASRRLTNLDDQK